MSGVQDLMWFDLIIVIMGENENKNTTCIQS